MSLICFWGPEAESLCSQVLRPLDRDQWCSRPDSCTPSRLEGLTARRGQLGSYVPHEEWASSSVVILPRLKNLSRLPTACSMIPRFPSGPSSLDPHLPPQAPRLRDFPPLLWSQPNWSGLGSPREAALQGLYSPPPHSPLPATITCQNPMPPV